MSAVDPKSLKPGDVIIHIGESDAAVIRERKADDSGWWLVDSGGIADFVFANTDWQTVAEVVGRLKVLEHSTSHPYGGVPHCTRCAEATS